MLCVRTLPNFGLITGCACRVDMSSFASEQGVSFHAENELPEVCCPRVLSRPMRLHVTCVCVCTIDKGIGLALAAQRQDSTFAFARAAVHSETAEPSHEARTSRRTKSVSMTWLRHVSQTHWDVGVRQGCAALCNGASRHGEHSARHSPHR